MSTEERSLREDARIDKFNLHLSAEDQPGLYAYWAEKAADARKLSEGLENKLKLEEATVATRLRGTLEKVTEGKIAEGVATDPGVIALKEDLVQADHERNLAEAAVRALDHRKSMIEVLARLWTASYYGDPKTNTRDNDLVQQGRATLNRPRES